jgi:hypothetical protein
MNHGRLCPAAGKIDNMWMVQMTHITAPRVPAPEETHSAPTANNATRHLSAGAYLDPTFRARVLREVYHQRRRLIAPSYGFDVLIVLAHCLRARNIALVADSLIVLTAVILAAVSPTSFLVVGSALLSLYVAVGSCRVIVDAVRALRSGASLSINAIIVRLAVLFLSSFIAYTVLLVAFIVFGLASMGTGPTSSVFPSTVPTEELDALGQAASGVILSLILLAIPLAATLVCRLQLERLKPGSHPVRPEPTSRFSEIFRQTTGNTVVFSDFSPFVGAGVEVNSWSTAQRLVRSAGPGESAAPQAQREFETPPFNALELIQFLHHQLRRIANDPTAEGHIPGLTVTDKVFVAGNEISDPTPSTVPQEVARIICYPTDPRRHYLVCQVVSWNSELVTTVHVHVALQGKALYLEQVTTVLPPCQPEYRQIDQVDGTGPVAFLRALAASFAATPVTIATAPLRLVRAAVDAIADGVRGGMGGLTRGFDYGAKVGVRELGMAETFRSHLQLQDVAKYSQLIERRLLASTLDFLELKGVDTSEFLERAVNILNAGVVQNGGSLTVNGPVTGQQTNRGPAGPAPRTGGGS